MGNTTSGRSNSSLFASLAFFAALVLLYRLLLVNFLRFPCQPLWISDLTFVLIAVALFQIVWERLRSKANQMTADRSKSGTVTLNFYIIEVPVKLKLLVSLFDGIYWHWPRQVFTITLIVIAFAGAAALKFPTVKEIPPVVLEFDVQSMARPVMPGDVIQVRGPTYISAKIEGSCAWPCRWEAIQGKVTPREGCSATYIPPASADSDSLTVIASSPCHIAQSQATIFIDSSE